MKKLKTFETLNALSGVAAVAVVLPRSQNLFGLDLAPSRYPAVVRSFGLSGVAITRSYERWLLGGKACADPALARVICFYPLLLVLVVDAVRAVADIATGNPIALTAPAIHRRGAGQPVSRAVALHDGDSGRPASCDYAGPVMRFLRRRLRADRRAACGGDVPGAHARLMAGADRELSRSAVVSFLSSPPAADRHDGNGGPDDRLLHHPDRRRADRRFCRPPVKPVPRAYAAEAE